MTAPGREHPPGAGRFSREVIDPIAGEGPLRGLLTALDALSTSLLLVVTVDMPAVRKEQLLWLIDELKRRPQRLGLMTSRQDAAGERIIEPFPSVFRDTARPVIQSRVSDGECSVHRLREDDRFEVLEAPPQWAFAGIWANLNSPADLAAFEKGGRF